jgi:hypothetical protein
MEPHLDTRLLHCIGLIEGKTQVGKLFALGGVKEFSFSHLLAFQGVVPFIALHRHILHYSGVWFWVFCIHFAYRDALGGV